MEEKVGPKDKKEAVTLLYRSDLLPGWSSYAEMFVPSGETWGCLSDADDVL